MQPYHYAAITVIIHLGTFQRLVSVMYKPEAIIQVTLMYDMQTEAL